MQKTRTLRGAGFCYDGTGKKKNLGDGFLFFREIRAPKSCAFNDPESTVTLRHPTPEKKRPCLEKGAPREWKKRPHIF